MFELDQDGKSLLHVAAASGAFDEDNFADIIDTCLDNRREDKNSSEIQEDAFYFERLLKDAEVEFKASSTLSCVLKANLESARFLDRQGNLPLHIAVEHHATWEEGVKDLIMAEPRALTSRNLESRLYPFMLAAMAEENDEMTNSAKKAFIIQEHATWEKMRLRRGKKVSASRVDKYASKLVAAFVDLPNLTTIYQLLRANPEPICCGIPIAEVKF